MSSWMVMLLTFGVQILPNLVANPWSRGFAELMKRRQKKVFDMSLMLRPFGVSSLNG